MPEEKYFQNSFTDKNQFVRQNEILLQNRLRIFDCNERKKYFDISISKRIQKSLKRKIQLRNI